MNELAEILTLMAERPLDAAVQLERMAEQLLKLAGELRQTQEDGRAPGGMGTRVRAAVVGPDGQVKQITDTRA